MLYNVVSPCCWPFLFFYFVSFFFSYFVVTLLPSFSLLRTISRMLCNMVLVICFKDTVMRYRYARWINLVWLIIVYLPLIIIIYYQRKDNRGSQTRKGMSAEGDFFLFFFFKRLTHQQEKFCSWGETQANIKTRGVNVTHAILSFPWHVLEDQISHS